MVNLRFRTGISIVVLVILIKHTTAASYHRFSPREDLEEITFDGVPNCTNITCFPFHSSSIGCPRFTQSCFCSALQPLKCANSACLGADWYAVEDWFASKCADVTTIDFSRFARCGRSCLLETIVPKWCNATVVETDTITRNCFCRITEEGLVAPEFADCLVQNCDLNETTAKDYLSEFWKEKCLLPVDQDADAPKTISDEEIVQFPRALVVSLEERPVDSGDLSGLSTPERWGLGLGLVSAIITIIGFIYTWIMAIWCFRNRRKNQTGDTRLCNLKGPPPPYSKA